MTRDRKAHGERDKFVDEMNHCESELVFMILDMGLTKRESDILVGVIRNGFRRARLKVKADDWDTFRKWRNWEPEKLIRTILQNPK